MTTTLNAVVVGVRGHLAGNDGVARGGRDMYRFEDDRYYRTSDPELRVIATPGTMAKWRCLGTGPPYIRFGGRVLYLGRDLNEWLDRHRVQTLAG